MFVIRAFHVKVFGAVGPTVDSDFANVNDWEIDMDRTLREIFGNHVDMLPVEEIQVRVIVKTANFWCILYSPDLFLRNCTFYQSFFRRNFLSFVCFFCPLLKTLYCVWENYAYRSETLKQRTSNFPTFFRPQKCAFILYMKDWTKNEGVFLKRLLFSPAWLCLC